MEYSDTVYLKAARKRERETKADDIIMRDEAILTPRVGRDDAEAKECIAKERS